MKLASQYESLSDPARLDSMSTLLAVTFNQTLQKKLQRVPRDGIKLALPGFRHLVDWWDLPTRLEWALAPDRGALGYQTGSLAGRMAFGRLRRPWEQN